MAVISGIAGGELAAPVEREAEPLQLRLHRRDVRPGPFAGMDLPLHRRILGRHAERVPAHRVEHFEARSSAGSGRARRPSCSCGHGPCGCAPTDRGTSPGHRPWAGRSSSDARNVPASSQTFCQCASAFSGLKRDAIAGSFLASSGPIAAIAARRRSRARVRMMSSSRCTVAAVDRRVDPLAVLLDLARGGDAQRVGAQVAVEDRDRHLGPLAGVLRVGIPFGDDHAAVGIGLGERREGERLQRGAPQIGVDADRRHLAGGHVGAGAGPPAARPGVRLMSSRKKWQPVRATAPATARPRESTRAIRGPWKRKGRAPL